MGALWAIVWEILRCMGQSAAIGESRTGTAPVARLPPAAFRPGATHSSSLCRRCERWPRSGRRADPIPGPCHRRTPTPRSGYPARS
ncbi:hypothetical protein SNL152K_8916 [Streptomyces sp. NL15-2K]|nr:hypothetical protein SNL152K_8916 [Streptomyces sp. NL15-2K]